MNILRTTMMLCLFTVSAMAVSQAGPPNFTQMDTDADGRISMDEARSDVRVADGFAEADKDGDGFLSAEEFTAAWILNQE